MDDVIVRTLHPDEWQRYRTLRLEALATEPQAFASTLDEQEAYPESYWRRRLADTIAGDRAWLVFAERQGALVGMLGAMVKGDPDTAEAMAFYVSPSSRGRGVGGALLDRLIADLRRTPGIATLRLTVNELQAAAIRRYESRGFAIVDREPEHPESRRRGATVTMRLPLAD